MDSSSLRVLVIDDSELSCTLLSVILRSADYRIVGVANDAKTGIRLAAECKPDIIFLDIVMPGETGFEALVKLRKSLPGATIVMISRLDECDMVTAAIQLGANGYVHKPFNSSTIFGTMKKMESKFVIARPVPQPA